MSDSIVPPIEELACTMKGHQARNCTIHSKTKKKNALFNYQRRKQKAEKWFQDQGNTYEITASKVEAIDLNRPVGFKTLKKGKVLEQWVKRRGKAGSDFTEPGTDPGTLGIIMDPKTNMPLDRELKRFIVDKDIKVMRCWCGDAKRIPGKLIGGKGGGPQLSMPKSWQSSVRGLQE